MLDTTIRSIDSIIQSIVQYLYIPSFEPNAQYQHFRTHLDTQSHSLSNRHPYICSPPHPRGILIPPPHILPKPKPLLPLLPLLIPKLLIKLLNRPQTTHILTNTRANLLQRSIKVPWQQRADSREVVIHAPD